MGIKRVGWILIIAALAATLLPGQLGPEVLALPLARAYGQAPSATGTVRANGSAASSIYLPVVQKRLPSCDPYEPNDNRRENPWGPLQPNVTYSARLCTGDVADSYWFDTAGAGLVEIHLQLPDSLVGHVGCWLYAQQNLAVPIGGGGPVGESDYRLLSQITQGGGYVILINSDGTADEVYPYTLLVRFAAGPTRTATATPTRTLTPTPTATPTRTRTATPTPIPGLHIEGHVYLNYTGGPGLEGATVRWQRSGNPEQYGTTTADSSGHYDFDLIPFPDPPVLVNVTASHEGYSMQPVLGYAVWYYGGYTAAELDFFARSLTPSATTAPPPTFTPVPGGTVTPATADICATSGPEEQYQPAAACSPISGTVLVVWEDHRNGAGDADIYGTLLRLDGERIITDIPVHVTSHDQSGPAIAYNEVGNEYLVVWGDLTRGGWESYIRGRRISALGEPLGAPLTIGGGSTWQINPSIAYNSRDNEYLVVWEDGTVNVWGQRVDSTGALVGAPFTVTMHPRNQMAFANELSKKPSTIEI